MFGGGLWGTVLAQHLARKDRPVVLWEFVSEAADSLHKTRRHPHIPGFRLGENVLVTSGLKEAAAGADVLLFVLPSAFVRSTARALKGLVKPRTVAVNASKGIEPKTLMTMGEVISDELPRLSAVYTLSGPSFAREVAKGVPTRMVLAGPRKGAEDLRRLFDHGALRVQWSQDRKGVELGGSLKNVLAIGCGLLDGLKAGSNTKAALIVQGMAEMDRLIVRCGGKAETVFGLAGLGDLIATGTSPESRNRAFGEKVGAGLTAKAAMREIPTVVEGVEAAGSAHALAGRARLACPLIDAVWGVAHAGRPARGVLKALGF
ncbi:MAG: NAD(P)H-dependent glycerol-3-phosphate dehydrogenase [Elusimicrobiota bacterium]